MQLTPDIRESIAAAVQQERACNLFREHLLGQLPRLKSKLVLPDDDPASALIAFITSYIESVPGSISLVTAVSKQLGFYRYAAPFLHMAEDYFIQPPDGVASENGLEALLDEAFLAHRLLEEVNDHHIRHLGRPLLPVDMTEANIIVHHLLGDALASRLEGLVQFTTSRLLAREGVWDSVRARLGATEAGGFDGRPAELEQQIRIRTGTLDY